MANKKSFQLLRTNTELTGNVKVVVNSDYKLFLESYNTNSQLSDNRFKHYAMYKEQNYDMSIGNYFYNVPNNIVFDVRYNNDNSIMESQGKYINQFDTMYYAGASNVEDQWYSEEFEYHAPLYIKPNKLPESFVILRVDEPAIFNPLTGYVIDGLNKDNFRQEILDKWKLVSLYDMTVESDLGTWLDKNFVDNSSYPTKCFEFDAKKYNFSRWYGLDYKIGAWSEKDYFMDDKLYIEQPHFRFEKYLTNGFKDNGLIYPHILNLKFLFDDTPANPFELKKWSINRYYGFYIDQMDLVTTLTSYDPPTLLTGITIVSNIFVSETDLKQPVYPFVEAFDSTKKWYIYAFGDLQEVVETIEDGQKIYKILSSKEITLNDINYNGIVDITFSNTGRTQYENIITGRYTNLEIDPYINKSSEKEGLYGDLYLVEIDSKYHVLKHKNNLETFIFGTGGTIFQQTGFTCNDIVGSSDFIFVATDSGITTYDWNGNILWNGNTTNSDLPSNKVNSLYLYDKILYAGTANGIWIKTFTNFTYYGNEIINTTNSNLSSNKIEKIYYKDYIVASCNNGTYWTWWTNYNGITTSYTGLTGLTLDNKKINSFSIDANDLYVAEGNRIRKYYDFKEEEYMEYSSVYNKLLENVSAITDIYVENEILYVSTDDGFWLKNGPFEKLYNTKTGYELGSNKISKMVVNSTDGYVYLTIKSGLTSDGVYFLNYFENTVEQYTNTGNSILINPIGTVIKGGDDEIAIGALNGIQIFNLPVNTSTTFKLFDYYLNTDYAINSNSNILEYWIESKDSDFYISKPTSNEKVQKFSIWRMRFSDIKDFDFDRVDTGFADFDYLQDNEYTQTDEPKLYAREYRDITEPKAFKVYETGEDQGKIIHVSSEYIADDELWEITKNKDLSDIWRKNQTVCKWGATDSISHSDYPYKLNNSYSVGSVYNRTCDVSANYLDLTLKNLDYFYRIGELISGSTPIHYYQQSSNIETSLMNPDSRKFNLDQYIRSDFDYFDYFFDNYMLQRINNLDENLKSTQKYSIFNNGDKFGAATTIFNGINYNLVKIKDIVYDQYFNGEYYPKQIISDDLSSQKYNGYKLSVIFNPAYQYQTSCGSLLDNRLINALIWYNPLYMNGYDFFNNALTPPVRGYDSGSTYDIILSTDTYSSLTYYQDDTKRVRVLFENIEQDEILYLKSIGSLYKKISKNISEFTNLPEYGFAETDLRKDYVLFSGTTYYKGEDLNSSITMFYNIVDVENERFRFISLTKWDVDDFINNYLTWKNANELYIIDLELTNGSIYDTENILNNNETNINVFLNDVYENCLVVVNTPITMKQEYISLNNVSIFGEKQGLYFGRTINDEEIVYTGYTATVINSSTTMSGDYLPTGSTTIKKYKDKLYVAINDGRLWTYNEDYNLGEFFDFSGKSISSIETLIDISSDGKLITFTGNSLWIYDIENDTETWINTGSSISGETIPTGFTTLKMNYFDDTNKMVYLQTNTNPDDIWEYNITTNFGRLYQSGFTNNGDTLYYNGTNGFYKDEPNNMLYICTDQYLWWEYDINNNLGKIYTKNSISGDTSSLSTIISNNTFIKENNKGYFFVDSIDYNLYEYDFNTNMVKYLTVDYYSYNLKYKNNNLYYISYDNLDIAGGYNKIWLMRYDLLEESKNSIEYIVVSNEASSLDLKYALDDNYVYIYSLSGDSSPLYEISNFKIYDPSVDNIIYSISYDNLNQPITSVTCVNPVNYYSFYITDFQVIENSVYSVSLTNGIHIFNSISIDYDFDPEKILAKNFIDTINNINDSIGFDLPVIYHHIDKNKNYYKYVMTGNTVSPFILTVNMPQPISTKKDSISVTAIKGPDTNIYNFQKPGQTVQPGDIVTDPLARYIELNEKERPYTSIKHGETLEFTNTIFRYNGAYEPIFKRVNVFNKTDYKCNCNINDITVYNSGYRFDDGYVNFGNVDEIIFTKVNEEESTLKLKNVEERSIYPMVSEFGYDFKNRFIFKSNWDSDFFIRTTNNLE